MIILSSGSLIQFALLLGFVVAVTLSLLIGLCERRLRRLLAGKAPSQQARIVWWMLVTPALAGVSYAALTIAMPSMLESSIRFAEACSSHVNSLFHLCVWHPGGSAGGPLLWALLAGLAAYAGWLAVRAALGLWRARQQLMAMLRLSRRPDAAGRVHVLDVEQPMALAYGIGPGHILLSTALMRHLDDTQLQVVLAHEKAHLAHRDVPYRLLAGVLSGIQLPGVRRRLLRDLDLALEQCCDAAAARAVGCPLTVAETIVAVEKMFRSQADLPRPLSMAFFANFVPERVEALLAPERPTAPYLGTALGVGVVAFCSLSTGWLHALTESLVSASVVGR